MRHDRFGSDWFGATMSCALGLMMAIAVGVSVADARPASTRYPRFQDETVFDGPWSVLIQADNGPCAGSYRYGVNIVDGTVLFQGEAYGRVAPNGNVQVRLSLGDKHAEGYGRLVRDGGGGVWRGTGQSGVCTGRWVAQRRSETYGAGH